MLLISTTDDWCYKQDGTDQAGLLCPIYRVHQCGSNLVTFAEAERNFPRGTIYVNYVQYYSYFVS